MHNNNNYRVKIFSFFIFISLAVFNVKADYLEEARQMVNGGQYEEARELLSQALDENENLVNNAIYQYLLGVCEFEDGYFDSANRLLSSAKSKGNGLANLYLGKLAFLDYDFDKASDYFDNFKIYRKKLSQTESEEVAELETQMEVAENALERVEKIVVLDSISVPKKDFFLNYRLSDSSGAIITPKEMPFKDHSNFVKMAFINEDQDYLIWAEPDSVGNLQLVENIKLIDKGWQEPQSLPEEIAIGRNANYPFMSADGMTLYYAADGMESRGGLDICIAKKDPITGEYLQPMNIGMPFNSPYDDYMMALDEETGVGWWATDRNRLGDKITIYVYVLNDGRKNYDPDDVDLLSYAKLDNFMITQEDSKLVDRKIKEINSIKKTDRNIREDFVFPLNKGKVLRRFSELKNEDSRTLMRSYLDKQKEIQKKESALNKLRIRYKENKADNVKEEIIKEEKTLEADYKQLADTRNKIYKIESSE